MKAKVGDVVCVPVVGNRQVLVPCPVCFGKERVTLILGDDSQLSVECDYCGKGYATPQGLVAEYTAEPTTRAVIITEVRTAITTSKETIEYMSDCSYHTEDKIFATAEEALEAAKKMAAEQQLENEQRVEYLKKDQHKKFSWNAGYHRREAKRCREEAERHDQKAVLCAARAKDKEEGGE